MDRQGAVLHFGVELGNDEGEIQAPIIDFLRNHQSLFPKMDDKRFAEVCSIFSTSHRPPVSDNNRRKQVVKVRPGKWREFREFWELINRKAKIVYRCIDEEQLIQSISDKFNKEEVVLNSPCIRDEILHTHGNTVETMSEDPAACQAATTFDPGVFASELARDERFPIAFVCRLVSRLKREWFVNDRVKARENLLKFMQQEIHAGILQGIDYQFTETTIYPNSLQNQDKSGITKLAHTELGRWTYDEDPPSHFLYDRIAYDSAIEQESAVSDPRNIDGNEITVFAKLPKINIPTPYKNYNPDFAYLIRKPDGQTLYLVVETKGYDRESDIPEDESQKISYGQKFFDKLNEEYPDVKVVYKTRINRQKLHELLRSVASNR